MAEAIQLLVATVVLRPYVFVFLAFYLTAATVAIGWRRIALFTGIAWVVAFSAEYSSARMVFRRYLEWRVAPSCVGRGVLS
ncbi:MAG TPA: hypothetical protein VN494_11295 [Patescibacteria group bacterium]|nr:hypothetical protein [Patescibacteria group bacterium]